MNDETDPILEAIAPDVGNEPDTAESGTNVEDPRDAYFGGENEQTYSAPSAPVLDPPLKKNPEVQAEQKANAEKAKSIGPLI